MEWSRQELDASVKAYINMRNLEQNGERFTKKVFYDELSSKFGRTPKAFEYRMQNISYVYSLMGRSWIKGLKPMKNVGSNVLPIIEELILENESISADLHIKFDERVNKIRKRKSVDLPTGKGTPFKRTTNSTTYERDPQVVAWLLEESKGICENCDKEAPFIKVGGDFYLEVHHLRRLADGGSDTVSNAIAVCPNCHRELHYGREKEEILDKLYVKIDRLRRE